MNNKSLLIESHYLPSIEYIALLSQYERVEIELEENFQKQSLRNRCYILGANKVLKLVVPIKKQVERRMAALEIDYNDNWIKDHWRSIESSYNRSPFFIHYRDELLEILNSKHVLLAELNHSILTFCLKKLDYNINLSYTTRYEKNPDKNLFDNFRGVLSAKQSFTDRSIIKEVPYYQMFGKTFAPNLSILDILFCEGPAGREIISRSLNN